MRNEAGSRRSEDFFSRKIVPVEKISVPANESLVVLFY
jgi:hypothetical protein